LPKLDELTLGLRGLMLLAAPPNAGKTALAIQLGLDAVVHNKDAAFLFVSLEMSRWDMLTRFKSRLAGLNWKTLVFGSGGFGANAQPFTNEEFAKLETAHKTLLDIGGRLRILDDKNFPAPTLEKVLDQVEDLKAVSGSSRVFVAVDYLQVWPVPGAVARHIRTDIDADKWRIGQRQPPPPKPVGSPWAVARWPKDLRDEWEERAAIIEYDAGEPRPVAERQAYEIVRTIMRLRFTWQRK
jgi:hypothetical protein